MGENAKIPEKKTGFPWLVVVIVMTLVASCLYAYMMYKEVAIAKQQGTRDDEYGSEEPEGEMEPLPELRAEMEPVAGDTVDLDLDKDADKVPGLEWWIPSERD
jgi:flagellar basal body-associated protein FliL